MKTLKNKTAVITGAGTGIGRALAIKLAGYGVRRLILADINQETLAQTAQLVRAGGGESIPCLVDVADRTAVANFAEKASSSGSIDILVNNAGVALSNVSVANMSYEDLDWILGINLHGVINCTKAFLPHLMKAPEGSLVNISSVYGLTAVAKASAYCASKFAVRGFTESLRQELKGTNIAVTVVHPGGVRSNIARNTRMAQNGDRIANPEQAVRNFEQQAKTTPEQAAGEIINAILKKKPRLIIGQDARFLDLLARINPAGYDGFMLKHVVKPAEKSH